MAHPWLPRKRGAPARAKFFTLIEKSGTHWMWVGAKNRSGLGVISDSRDGKSKSFTAPRLSWVIHRGPIPDGFVIYSLCGDKNCVNPDHLALETPAEMLARVARPKRHP